MEPIFLIGYMAVGKTTLGRALADRLGLRFIDLDDTVEQHAGMTVGEIFATGGQDEFRVIERDALREVAVGGDSIVACGGGTPCYYDNMALMNGAGTTVWLYASDDRLVSRLVDGRASRPIIAGLSESEIVALARRQMASREPYYSCSAYRFDSSFLETPEEIEATCRKFIKQIILHKN